MEHGKPQSTGKLHSESHPGGLRPGFSPLGVWAFSIGTSIGWGSFIVTCSAYLQKSGVLGTVFGLLLGMVVILVITWNLQYMIRLAPNAGGIYTFEKSVSGKDLGFLALWFVLLTYMAILWANITSLPLFARFFLGRMFQFGFHYSIFGYEVWFGEALLSICAVVLIGLLCCRSSRLMVRIMVIAALIFAVAFTVCAVIAVVRHENTFSYSPLYLEGSGAFAQIVRIAVISPWAFIGFENIAHFSEEYTFPVKKVRGILISSVLVTTLLYLFVSLLSVSAYPPEYESWLAYIRDMGNLEGIKAVPAFYAANHYLGQAGVTVLMLALFAVILTSLIGNLLALSRLLYAAGREGEMPGRLAALNRHGIPFRAIAAVVVVSVFIPFLGRTAIGWIVDVTTLGATIIYGLISHAVYRHAQSGERRAERFTGIAGMALMVVFVLLLLIPGLLPFHAMETESYFLFIVWSVLGLVYFRILIRRDVKRVYGQRIVVWILLLVLVMFASMMWVSRATENAANDAVQKIFEYHESHPADDSDVAVREERVAFLQEQAKAISDSNTMYSVVSLGLFLIVITMMLNNYRDTQKLGEKLTSAEEASRAKTSFLSSMSHEIRTPMNAIIGLDTLALKNENLDEETREYLEKIGGSARHLLSLINDILDMSRIESGRVILHREVFSFSAMLEQINTMVTSQCEDKGLTYECRILGRMEESYIGDEMKLKQVLINILSNAVKFTEAPGSVTLTVERTAAFENQSTVRFRIRDTGIGMDQEFIPRIFDAFSQEDIGFKSKFGSTGLGMAITKRIVEMMNGSISVESEQGEGTEFAVSVTLRNCDQKGEEREITIDPQTLNVLVVDDDPIEAEHARTVLEEVGIRADTSTSAQEALRMMEVQHSRHKPYNLVLMDWNMPGMNGLEASAEIRKQYDTESTVVVLTAYNWDDIQEEAHRVGVDSFLAKPLLPENVIEEFERIARRNNMTLFREKKRANLSGRLILLAEDMEINAEIMMDTLELDGIRADHAENGRIALEMFKESRAGDYAAILMDVRMPEMDGLEAASAIRSLDREDAKKIPIIALTANAFDEDVQRSLQAGMNAHLSKPVDSEQLLRTLSELVYEAESDGEG